MTSKNGPMQTSMFSSEALLANHSPLQDSGKVWLTLEETSHSSILLSLNDTVSVGWYGKTCPVSCQVMEDGTLVPLSGGWSNSGMASHGECLTLSTSEFHSGADVCSLSDILEGGNVPQKYYLSPKACAGILRRAEKRGKTLPLALQHALEVVVASEPTPHSTPNSTVD